MAIYKTRNTGTGNGMGGIQGTRRMFTRIPRNLLEDSGEFSGFSIPGNFRKDSRECSGRIPGNASNFKLIKAAFHLKKANVT